MTLFEVQKIIQSITPRVVSVGQFYLVQGDVFRNICGRENTQIKLRGNQTVKQVDEFAYLGNIISNDGRHSSEIIKRICQAKIAFNSKKTLLASRNVNLKIRKNLLKTYVWSIALYGCETRTITIEEENRRRLESFKMWCYRRMLRISWVDRITNEEVLERISEEKLI